MKFKKLIAIITTFALSLTAVSAYAEPQIQMRPVHLDLTATPGETLTESLTLTNTGDEPYEFTTSATPYWVASSADRETNFINRLGHYNDIVDWTTVTPATYTIAPSGTTTIDFTITVPECSASSHQWMTIFAEGVRPDSATSGIQATINIGGIVNLELENNHPENCGGTAEDENPYTVVTITDRATGEEHDYTYRTDYYNEHADEIYALLAGEPTFEETVDTAIDVATDYLWILWVVLGAIALSALILLIVFLVKKSHKSTPPTTPTTPEAPSTPLAPPMQ